MQTMRLAKAVVSNCENYAGCEEGIASRPLAAPTESEFLWISSFKKAIPT